jgi:hypothetical protein
MVVSNSLEVNFFVLIQRVEYIVVHNLELVDESVLINFAIGVDSAWTLIMLSSLISCVYISYIMCDVVASLCVFLKNIFIGILIVNWAEIF